MHAKKQKNKKTKREGKCGISNEVKFYKGNLFQFCCFHSFAAQRTCINFLGKEYYYKVMVIVLHGGVHA